jgi:hypothetical protein
MGSIIRTGLGCLAAWALLGPAGATLVIGLATVVQIALAVCEGDDE